MVGDIYIAVSLSKSLGDAFSMSPMWIGYAYEIGLACFYT